MREFCQNRRVDNFICGPFFDFYRYSQDSARAEFEGLGSYHETFSGFVGSKGELGSPYFVYKGSVCCNRISSDYHFIHIFHIVAHSRVHNKGCGDSKAVKVPDCQQPLAPGAAFSCDN
ncbi:hypothetical protein DSECCO2_521780 [anaerobic digester metagenome]